MPVFDKLLKDSKEYEKIRTAAQKGVSPVHITGTADSEKAQLLYELSQDLNKKLFIVTANEISARKLEGDISVLCKDTVRISEKELNLRKVDALGRDTLYNKLSLVKAAEEASAVIVSAGALMQLITPREKFDAAKIDLRVGESFDLSEFSEKLSEIGYTRCETVEGRGCYSIRGGIVDIFSPDATDPIRMEFFDDEIDSMREFDVETQKSTVKIEATTVIAAAETDETGSLLSYIDPNSLAVIDEPVRVFEAAKAIQTDISERVKTLIENGNIEEVKEKYINSYAELLPEILKMQTLSVSMLSDNTPEFKPRELCRITVKSVKPYSGNADLMAEDVLYYKTRGYRIIVMAGSNERIKRLSELFTDNGISISTSEEEALSLNAVLLLHGSLSSGFEYPLIKTVVISDRDISQSEHRKKRRRAKGKEILNYNELVPGDYVVHETHGIGRFSGMQRINTGGSIKDYLKLVYRGDDVLYVPVGQLDMLHKYKSGIEDNGEIKVKLNKLGGAEWKKTKSSVKANVALLAEKLVKLYAQRSEASGHMFGEDTEWQREFEAEFIYDETDDQLKAIEEMKEDMESAKPMDRLLLGDVGFGKTEVAMRGAFKCVSDGLQVAYLVPTTVLAAQQYATFSQRMKNYPITVEMLSRFKSKKASEDIIRRTKKGEVDILIGTHKILQKSVGFKNLGLLIIDEEQRFGVAHKEAIKELKTNIDVLSLSATPIPRSLNMAMIGIRDMSILSEPPEERLPVQTYAMEYNSGVIYEAIDRELARGGQVYYLCNRVSGIYKKAEEISAMFPDFKVSVGHGQMSETELENVMMDMVDGKIDVLVCTTIIETGLDIPNVNTIIIEDADKMGLAQLYQLRGRVGRSNRLAYAYLTYKRDKVLSEVAEKRLRAIKEFTEFGSGFKIAARDLELRGAGNVLGPEQSGFMSSVGYEIYCELLRDAVSEAKGERTEEKKECLIDLEVNAYIPESYISSAATRIEIYKKIAGIEDQADSYSVSEELEDRFGDIPPSVYRLIDVAMIRGQARHMGIEEISSSGEKLLLYPDESMKNIPEAIAALNKDFRGKVMFSAAGRNTLSVRSGKLNYTETIEFVKKVLQSLKSVE